MLDYARHVQDKNLETAIVARATDFYAEDVNCPVHYEPSGSDFFSPCLAEAVLMSKVLEQNDFVSWLDGFMPAIPSDEFKPLTLPLELKESYLPETVKKSEPTTETPTEPSEPEKETQPESESASESESESEPAEDEQLKGAKSHLIGLAFYRAGALKRLAAALPKDDARKSAYQKLAAIHGESGFRTMYEADYVGTHWLASYAVYMLSFR
jgi:hypothetical protein